LAAGRLQGSPYVAIRRIAVQYDQGVLFLRGRVTRFYEKQLAQEAVANLDGVVRVVNEIEVE
jgi:osmotically-inducible protein OsmY